MKIHCIRHEPFEGLASIENWIDKNKYDLSVTYTYMNQVLPNDSNFDMLIVMGGTASVYNSINDPWFVDEKRFIEKCLRKNKIILGICLGAQMLAEVLGSKVYAAKEKEIGWFPVRFNTQEISYIPFLPNEMTTLHWHGDIFDLPASAIRLGSSDCTENQGFIYGNNVFALQFHPEVTGKSLKSLVRGSGWELKEQGPYIQSLDEIMNERHFIETNKNFMYQLLNYITKESSSAPKM